MYKYKFIFVSALICVALVCCCFFYKPQTATSPVYYQKTVLIDAGHGYPDGGATGLKGTVESDINLDIAFRLKALLEKSGFNVLLTRYDKNTPIEDTKDKKIREIKREDLTYRRNMLNSGDADLFISIHQNKFTDSKYYGAQVFYPSKSEESKHLGGALQRSLADVLDNNNERVEKETSEIFILKNATIPSALVECGFLSNEKEESLLNTEKYRKKIAWAIFCGIINYIS